MAQQCVSVCESVGWGGRQTETLKREKSHMSDSEEVELKLVYSEDSKMSDWPCSSRKAKCLRPEAERHQSLH